MSTVEIIQKHLPTLDEAITRFLKLDRSILDDRDTLRLAAFLSSDQLSKLDFAVIEGEIHNPLEWTADNVSKELAEDVAFAFEKALNRRGISAYLMAGVLEMWHAILQPPFDLPKYRHYGLPIAKSMAVYFELDNQIGDKNGDEFEFSTEAEGI